MQSNHSQMTPKTKEADRSSPVTETGNSMSRAPTQELDSPDARVQPSARKTSQQHTRPQGHSLHRGGRGGRLDPIFRHLSLPISQDPGEEHITQETSRETRQVDAQDGTSSQQMKNNIHSTHSGKQDNSGHHNHHGQAHDERGDANTRGDIDNRDANKGKRGEGEREVKEVEGNELSTNQSPHSSDPVRKPNRSYHRKGSTHDAITHSGRRDDSGHHGHRGQTRDERGDANVRKDVDDGGTNEREREVKEAEGNELSTNQSPRRSHPVHKPYTRREDARDDMFRTLRRENNGTSPQQMNRNNRSTNSGRRDDSGHHSRYGQTHDEQDDANVREEVVDEGANEGEEDGERGVNEAEGSTNQGQHPSHRARKPYYRRESAREAIYRLEGTLRSRERDVHLLSTRNEELSDEIKTLKDELTRLQLEQDRTGQLLHERTVELSSAQLFLGKADTISVTDVSRMVDLLNAEISQASNSIADSLFDHQVTPATTDTTELNRLLHKERPSIGDRLCDILARRLCQPSVEVDPMITQLALQAGLSKACYLIINDWNPPFWDSSSIIDRIYANMRLSVGQVTAGRWRALARTYFNRQDSEDEIQGQDAKERIQDANADYLRSTLRDLLTIVGWSPRDSHQDLPSEYSEKMRFLSDEALKLNETIGRGITSKDLIVEIISCGTPFDPTKMDNADRQRVKLDAIPDDSVTCTVELGLRYKSARSGGDSEETGVILKPKVLLASVLVVEDKEDTPPKPQD